MQNAPAHSNKLTEEAHPFSGYIICIEGHLSPELAGWLGDVQVENMDNGQALLFSPTLDQAALHGALNHLRDLGIRIVSVQSQLAFPMHDTQQPGEIK
jgi:hypothetical protein